MSNETNHGGTREGAGAKPKEPRKTLHRNIPISQYDRMAESIDAFLEKYRKDEIESRGVTSSNRKKNYDQEMKEKIMDDGWSLKKSGNSYYASKSADETVRGETICDLFESIYGSREYNKDLKPIKKN
jgi:hypothetical protein